MRAKTSSPRRFFSLGRPDRHTNLVVLLVQPERDDREMYVEYLRYEGFTPVPVSTATDALRASPRAAVIVTGLLLPGEMDGIEFVTRLKSHDRMKHIPTIVLTACAWDSERERAVAAGCDLFLPKPCLPDVLVRHIRRLLALRLVPTRVAAHVPLAPPRRARRTS